LAIAGSLIASGCTVAVRPEHHAEHPAYLHALADLRDARGHLWQGGANNRQTAWDESVAIREIDAAINEIKQAAVDDGKNLNDHPPVDARTDWPGRMHRALELLHKARQDCTHEEDNGWARDMQGRAIHHIDEAIRLVEQGIQANRW
jgi:hypothetical protein